MINFTGGPNRVRFRGQLVIRPSSFAVGSIWRSRVLLNSRRPVAVPVKCHTVVPRSWRARRGRDRPMTYGSIWRTSGRLTTGHRQRGHQGRSSAASSSDCRRDSRTTTGSVGSPVLVHWLARPRRTWPPSADRGGHAAVHVLADRPQRCPARSRYSTNRLKAGRPASTGACSTPPRRRRTLPCARHAARGGPW